MDTAANTKANKAKDKAVHKSQPQTAPVSDYQATLQFFKVRGQSAAAVQTQSVAA